MYKSLMEQGQNQKNIKDGFNDAVLFGVGSALCAITAMDALLYGDLKTAASWTMATVLCGAVGFVLQDDDSPSQPPRLPQEPPAPRP